MAQQPVTRIAATNFRSLRDVDVPLGPLTVLIGPNGSGKTNVLNVLRFLKVATELDLLDALDEWRGFEHVQRRTRDTGAVEITVEGRVTRFSSARATDVYTLKISRARNVLRRHESFLYKRTAGQGRRRRIDVSGTKISFGDEEGASEGPGRTLASGQTLGLATLPRLSDEEGGEGIRDFEAFLSDLYVLEPNVSTARDQARPVRGQLAPDASNLAAALQSLARSDAEAFQTLQEDVRRCLPGLREIVFEDVGGGSRGVVVRLLEQGVTQPVDLVDASFGTVRLLALLVALHDPRPPRLTAIEEVDHGLHPYALDVLVDRMRAATARTQLLITTHSPTLVNRLSPSEVVICDRDPRTGESVIPAVDADEIASAIEQSGWQPGELWFSGSIHGVPA